MTEQLRLHFESCDPVMAGLMRAAGPYRLVPRESMPPFETLARAIANQQISGLVADRILARFVALFGGPEFPPPHAVLARPAQELRAVGFSFAKVASLKDLAEKSIAGIVPESAALATLEDMAIIERLTQVRGVGRWTVEMLLMFQLGRPDVLPVDDFGVRNGFRLAYGLRGLPTPRALAAFGERWAPYRSAAAWYLWRACELYRAGTLPEPAAKPRGVRIVKKKRRVNTRTKRGKAPAKPGARKARAAPSRRKLRKAGARRARK